MLNYIWKKRLVFVVITIFTLTSVMPSIVGEENEYFYANQDIPVENGGISGDYTDTFSSDDTYEAISEIESNSKPSKRYSYLEHKWTFDLTGLYDSIDFYIEAYHTSNSEGDDFVFAYSTNDVDYTDILTVTKESDDNNYQSTSMPDTLSGMVYIRVKDTDQSQGNRVLDTIYIDNMYIKGSLVPDITPPVISDVISWDNENTWYNMSPSFVGGTLIGRERHVMAYDSKSDRTIIYSGGPQASPIQFDTWSYDLNNNIWYNMSPNVVGGNLLIMIDSAMAYDSNADQTILFGGSSYLGNSQTYDSNETWAYDYNNNTWYNMSPNVVGGNFYGRVGHRMVYDSSSDKIIMFGGAGYHNKWYYYNETWVYDYSENTWYNMSPEVVGGDLNFFGIHLMVYDSTADKTIMFGGSNTETDLSDTWAYDYNENTWYKLEPTIIGGTLGERTFLTGAYDSNADRTIMLGGQENQIQMKDTWIYDYTNNTWQKVNPTEIGGTLIQREAHTMVYDSNADRTILFGGFWGGVGHGASFFNDTWIYRYYEPTASITWQTDEASDNIVNYGTTIELGNTIEDTNLVTSHRLVLIDLEPDTIYYYEVQSTDEFGNIVVDDNNGNFYFVITGAAPIIDNVEALDVTHSTASINWLTHESSSSVLNYGTSTDLGNTILDSKMVIEHSIKLTHFEPETTYYYEVQSTDITGKTTIDDNGGNYYSFTTSTEPSNSMHVQSIDMWYYQQGQRFKLYTIVQMVDENDEPVDNAMVYLSINRTIGSFTRIVYESNDLTNSTGHVTFFYETKIKSLYTATVNDVVKEGWMYHPEDNVETSESIYVK